MVNEGHAVNILIAVSNQVLCEGLRRILMEEGGRNAFCHKDFNGQYKPDILLFDSRQDVPQLFSDFPDAKAILIDTLLSEQEIALLFSYHKIRGIIAHESSVRLFLKAISVVSRGEIWVDQKHLKNLLLHGGALSSRSLNELSEKDKQIIKLISHGLKNKEIGEHLFMSEHTVKAHVSSIYRRLNVSNRVQLTSLAKDNLIEEQTHPLEEKCSR